MSKITSRPAYATILNMDNNAIIAGHVKDLAARAYQNDYTTHSDFLSLSECQVALETVRKNGGSVQFQTFNGVRYCFIGGYEDAERRIMCFLPSYMTERELIASENENGSILGCIKVEAVNEKFADELGHRDYLGALMNMGIERSRIGDILCSKDSSLAYIFVMKDMEETIAAELTRIKHTTVKATIVPPSMCDIRPSFKEVNGFVASLRLDAILAFVYHMSRSAAQELVSRELVFVDGVTAVSPGYDLKEGSRVSVRGHGKFRFIGQTGNSRKGRLAIAVNIYD